MMAALNIALPLAQRPALSLPNAVTFNPVLHIVVTPQS